MSEAPTPPVVDEPDQERFVVEQNGTLAQLVYEQDGSDLLLLHTEVPDAFKGEGVGGRLVLAAVARARADGLTMVPWCPFTRTWLERHPDETTGVTIDFDRPPPRRKE
jgi:predicted GNAT family acetyltransferase